MISLYNITHDYRHNSLVIKWNFNIFYLKLQYGCIYLQILKVMHDRINL